MQVYIHFELIFVCAGRYGLKLNFFLTSLLEYNCITVLCQFLLHNKVNQLYAYVYPHFSSLLHLPPSHPPHPTPLGGHKALLYQVVIPVFPKLCPCAGTHAPFHSGSSQPETLALPESVPKRLLDNNHTSDIFCRCSPGGLWSSLCCWCGRQAHTAVTDSRIVAVTGRQQQ